MMTRIAVLFAMVLGFGSAAAQVTQGDGLGQDAPGAGGPEVSAPDGPEAEATARREQLDALFDQLADPTNEDWKTVEAQIWAQWNQSGSPAMDLLAGRADEAMAAGDLDTALVFLDSLVRLAPEFAEGWNKRATLYYMRDDYGASVADIGRTLALEPRHFGALSGLGIILGQLGDKPGSLRAYRRVVELNPHAEQAVEAVKTLAPDVDGRAL